jgi:ribonuclease HI
MTLRGYADGASRGNPGPAAIAYTVYTDDHAKVWEHATRVGTRTNNQAEYLALLAGLEYAAATSARDVACYLDSELVVKQLNGEYRVRNATLRRYWAKVRDVGRRLGTVSVAHLPGKHRYIREVDRLANQALDARGG